MCEWKCKRCGTTDKELQYPSGKMNKCKDCQRWYNITENSKRKRKYKKGPELNMTEEEFLKWCLVKNVSMVSILKSLENYLVNGVTL